MRKYGRRAKIEKGIPIPQIVKERHDRYKDRGGQTVSKYPWREMEIGDSFMVPALVKYDNMRSYASLQGLILKRSFIVGLDDDQVLRCWRVE